ncbi:hypothetical protein PIB30_010851 [Stylosanthes scabra]|uniref:RRM domain-containing protein n=1 Tax=Stylosanthes scabra TaxID=79078 RepID=A0ABU6R5J7_9FABA|nr:hypothetical protein [Stylosanthes scabra]
MGNLDPTAEEFWPRNHTHGAHHHPPPQPHSQPWYGYPYLAHLCPTSSPTRSLMLGLVPSATTAVTEAWLMRELGAFGDIRGLRMEAFGHGMVIAMVHFYDLRHAEAAFTAILGHHQQYYGAVLWVQYMVPSSCDDGHNNQGTLLLFNLDSHMDDISITNIFQPFGAVKEVRHAPLIKNQRFVEFFDIRDAAKAFKNMNGNQIHGKPLVIQFGPPSVGGGHYRKFKPPRALGSLQQHKFWSPFGRDVTKGSCYDDKTHSEELVGMGSMNLGDDEEFGNNGGKEAERNSPTKCDDESIVGDMKQLEQQTATSRRHRKGKHANLKKQHHHYETRRYLINQHATHDKDSSSSSFIDSRTTVMIKNIPNKYSQKLLLSMLDNHCNQCNEQIREGGHDHEPLSSYDFLYLPIDFKYVYLFLYFQ